MKLIPGWTYSGGKRLSRVLLSHRHWDSLLLSVAQLLLLKCILYVRMCSRSRRSLLCSMPTGNWWWILEGRIFCVCCDHWSQGKLMQKFWFINMNMPAWGKTDLLLSLSFKACYVAFLILQRNTAILYEVFCVARYCSPYSDFTQEKTPLTWVRICLTKDWTECFESYQHCLTLMLGNSSHC